MTGQLLMTGQLKPLFEHVFFIKKNNNNNSFCEFYFCYHFLRRAGVVMVVIAW